MAYSYPRPDTEVNDEMNKAVDGLDNGSRWPGMSYEQGVDAALRWITGESDDKPMDDN
jgi:hypothetical protein